MKKLYMAIAGALVLGTTGCIEETLPTDYVLQPQIEGSDAALAGMVGGIYTTMAGYENTDGGIEIIGYGSLRVMLEHSTTPLICTGGQGWNTMGAWCNGSVSANGSNRGIYPSYVYYGYIKGVNDIIGMIPEDTEDATHRAYLGISHAYRALYYHDLVQIMEYKKPTDPDYTYTQPENDLTNLGVPIVTEDTPTEKLSDNPRAKVDDVYTLILSDLKKAETYLTGYTRSDKTEPDLSVVYAMYARVYSSLASRAKTPGATYTDETEYWKKAAEYADKAKQAGSYSYLTEDQWTDPKTGFNDRNSQNSWMWATTISEGNMPAIWDGSFNFAMIMGTETDFLVYGWCVGRSLNRKMYEQLSDKDFRKQSWLAPNFFYESTNQVEGQPYLVEKDANGVLINNKWQKADGSWTDEYSGFGADKIKYRLSSSPSWIRNQITVGNGFIGMPWLYVNIKFRPHNGIYNNWETGGAVDFPIIRVEEMDFIKAEAVYHTSGAGAAQPILEALVKTRNPDYPADGKVYTDFMDELNFQKQIEFWGEGINYFDAKRQELGVHRNYLGTNVNTRSHCIEIDGVFPGWTPGWNQAERNGNTALTHYNNPYTTNTVYYQNVDLQWIKDNFGAPIAF